MAQAPGSPAGRAPRLRPDQRIAAHVTRAGRFRKIDPAKAKRPPRFWALAGRLGWAVLVEESLRRARKRVRAQAPGEDRVGEPPEERAGESGMGFEPT